MIECKESEISQIEEDEEYDYMNEEPLEEDEAYEENEIDYCD